MPTIRQDNFQVGGLYLFQFRASMKKVGMPLRVYGVLFFPELFHFVLHVLDVLFQAINAFFALFELILKLFLVGFEVAAFFVGIGQLSSQVMHLVGLSGWG